MAFGLEYPFSLYSYDTKLYIRCLDHTEAF
jgi:hypothetical protein